MRTRCALVAPRRTIWKRAHCDEDASTLRARVVSSTEIYGPVRLLEAGKTSSSGGCEAKLYNRFMKTIRDNNHHRKVIAKLENPATIRDRCGLSEGNCSFVDQ